MGIQVENTFVVPAPIEQAWQVLTDLPRVVPCMPGTELGDVGPDGKFRATARVKVGPVELQFRGEGELYDVDAAAKSSKMRARGTDTKGRGTFQTDIAFSLAPEGARTHVRVTTDLSLAGSVAQYGRGAGIVKEVTHQLTAQFARNLAAMIEAERPAAPPAAEAKQEAAPPDEAPAASPAPARAEAPAPADPSPRAARPPEAISGLRLLFAALKAMLRRWFGAKS